MDHVTHLVMTYKLLKSCGCDPGSCIYSVLPALDREPAHFHRVYAHVISNFPRMLTTATHIFCDDWPLDFPLDTASYEYERITTDRDYYKELVETAATVICDKSILNPKPDLVGGGIALLSHLYFDTYNNPVQAFLPNSVYPSGQWDFWRNTDYMEFRTKFYTEKAIEAFRKGFLQSEVWQNRLTASGMIKAMIIRLGDLSQPVQGYEVVDSKICEFFGFVGLEQSEKADEELRFCKILEKEIEALIHRSLKEA